MKKFLSLLLAFAMILSLVPVTALAAEGDPTITATADKTEASVGDTLEVTFTLANNPGFTNMELMLSFDKNVLQFTGLKTEDGEYVGRFSSGTTVVNSTVNAEKYGSVTNARANTSTANSDLFVAQFTVIGTGSTTVSVVVEKFKNITNDGVETVYTPVVTPSAAVAVSGIPATSVSLDKTELSLEEGQNFLLVATVEPDNTTDKVNWASDNTAVATVSDYGQVVAVGEGTANITATAGEAVRTCVVTVTKEKSIVKTGGTEDAALTGVRELKINDKVETVKNVYKVSLNGHEQTDLCVSGSSIGAVVYAIDGTAVAGAQYGTSMERQPMNQRGYEIQTRELLVTEAQLTAAVGESSISKLELSDDYIYAFLFVKDGMVNMNYGVLFEITPVAATGVEVQETMALAAGETGELTVSVLPADTTDDMTVTYSSGNEAVATVDAKGVVTAVDSGEAVITVSAAGHSATCTVTVKSGFTEIENVPGNGDMWAGSMNGITIKNVTVDSYQWNGKTLNVFIAEDTATATVVFNFNQNGYDNKHEETAAITNGSGTLTKTFTHNDGWSSYETTWVINFSKSVPATAIALDKTSMEMAAGTTGTIGATLTPENASGKITWNSSDPTVATVDQNGLVTAVANGAATITAAIDGFSATCQVTVSTATELPGLSDSEGLQKVYVLAAVEEHIEWVKGTDGVYSANAILPKGTPDGTQIKVTFEATTYGNTISEDVVCTLANGTAKAEYNFVSQWDASANKNYVLNFIVTQDVESVSLDQTAISLPSAGSAQLNATVAPESAAGMLIWSSSDETVVKVSNGALTAVGAGTATITAKAGDKTATCTVTVADPYTIPASEVPVVEGTYTVSDFTVTKATVESHSWDGDTLNIFLPAGTPNGTEIQLNTPVTNTSASTFYVGTKRVDASASYTRTTSITIAEGTATATINIGTARKQSDIKSYTVNVTVGGSAEPEPTTYTVTVDENITGGTVTASAMENIAVGTEITLTATPDDGYQFVSFEVKNGEETVTVTDGKFVMPEGSVTVSATFVEAVVNEETVIYTGTDWPYSGYYIASLTMNGPAVAYIEGTTVYLNAKTAKNAEFTLTAAAGGSSSGNLGVNWNDDSTNTKTYTTNLVDGAATVKVYAYKASGAGVSRSGTKTFTFRVAEPNETPTLATGVTAEATETVTSGTAYEVDLTTIFADADNEALTYTVSVNDGSAAAANAAYRYENAVPGTYVLKFTATDGKTMANKQPTYTVTLTVKNSDTTYDVGVTVPEGVVPAFYAVNTVNSGAVVKGDPLTYADGVVKVPENITRIMWEAENVKGFSVPVSSGAAVALVNVTFAAEYDSDPAESVTIEVKDSEGVKITETGSDTYLLPAVAGFTYKGTPAGSNYNAIELTEQTPASGEVKFSFIRKHFEVIAPKGSVVSAGTLNGSFAYSFAKPITSKEADNTVVYTFAPLSGNAFVRVQNPSNDAVTYWDWKSSKADGKSITITEDMLFIGDAFDDDTVYRNFEYFAMDLGDIYMNINNQGYVNLNVGDQKGLNMFRNWQAIESFTNARISLPDFSYEIIPIDGSDVIEITPDANNSAAATLTAKNEGTAIVLVTYDAMYSDSTVANSNGNAGGGNRYTAIWPDRTGVFVVSVGKNGTAIKSNMTCNGAIFDAEHSPQFYIGNAGASVSFTPDAGVTVTVNRSTVGKETLSFGSFTSEGVSVNSETGEVTVSGLTTGRHIIRLEKDGVASYQVVTAQQVTVDIFGADGRELGDTAIVAPGASITLKINGLTNPAEKFATKYNFNAQVTYKDENGNTYRNSSGAAYGKYDFSSLEQIVNVTIPSDWAGQTMTLNGYIQMGGFSGGAIGDHRKVSYGTASGMATGSGAGMVLGTLPELVINIATIPATELTLDKTEARVECDEPFTLTATLAPEDSTDVIEWISGDETIATVENGVVTGQSAGTTTITAKAGTLTAVCTVEVYGTKKEIDVETKPTANKYYFTDVRIKGVRGTVEKIEGNTYTILLDPRTKTTDALDFVMTANRTNSSRYFWVNNNNIRTSDGNPGTISIVPEWNENKEAVVTIRIANSNGGSNYDGPHTLNFKIAKAYAVTIDESITGGTVTASATENIAAGTEITLNAEPAKGYEFGSFEVECGDEPVTVTDGKFVMPEGDVTVSAIFTQIPNPITNIEISHPNIKTETNPETGAISMTMAMVSGVSEQIDLSVTIANADLDPTQVVLWSVTDEKDATGTAVEPGMVATVDDNGKITANGAGTAVVIAKAVDPSGVAAVAESVDPAGVAAAAEGEEVLAQFILTVSSPTPGYTVTMGEDVENTVIGSTVSVPVTIGHTDTAVTQYSAYDMSFTYDPAVLKLATFGTEITDVKDESGNSTGTIHVEHYGDKTDNGTALTLIFEAIATGETNVKVTAAKVDISESALTKDAPDASILDNITLVSVTGYTIELNEDFTGATSILPGETYVFEAKNKNYTYDFTGSTMGGQSVTITEIMDDNGNGTGKYQIENVSGNIVISSEKTGKTFKVTLTGDGIAPAEGFTSGENAAQYTVAYKAQLAEIDKWNYSYTVTIGGKEYTDYTVKDGVITISGEDITGEIAITVTRTAVTQDKHQVTIEGESGVVDKDHASEVENGQDYTFTVNKVAGFKYTVTATMDGQPVEVIDNGDGTYTIKNVTGNLKINVQKEYIMTVEVVENYVKVEGKSMFLVLAETAVDTGKVLSYDGTPMFYTTKYSQQTDGADAAGKWAYLVFTETTLSEDEAKAKITLADVSESVIKVTLDQTFNVNESGITDGDSIGTVDINDAQLVYDMYNAVYENFENGATMQKFLKADVNSDRKVDVNDAMAIVDEIIKAK